ncbi:MAG: hypothetical protein ACRYF2_17490 [Janthinobacterium lividum]
MSIISDTVLVRLCGEFIKLEGVIHDIYDGPNASHNEGVASLTAAPTQARQQQIIAELGDVQAATAVGVLARARALAAFNGHFGFSFDHPDDDGAGRMLAYLLRDAAAIGAPLPRTMPKDVLGDTLHLVGARV